MLHKNIRKMLAEVRMDELTFLSYDDYVGRLLRKLALFPFLRFLFAIIFRIWNNRLTNLEFDGKTIECKR